jgi:hypothetical protein
MRLRLKALKGQPATAGALESHLGAVEGITRVEVNALTGSVLLHYDPCMLSSPEFLNAFSEAMGKAFPGRVAPGRLELRVERLRGDVGFAAAVCERLTPVPGIERLEIDASTGTCLLLYDPEEVTRHDFVERISGPLGELLPGLDLRGLAAKAGFRPR